MDSLKKRTRLNGRGCQNCEQPERSLSHTSEHAHANGNFKKTQNARSYFPVFQRMQEECKPALHDVSLRENDAERFSYCIVSSMYSLGYPAAEGLEIEVPVWHRWLHRTPRQSFCLTRLRERAKGEARLICLVRIPTSFASVSRLVEVLRKSYLTVGAIAGLGYRTSHDSP